MMNTDPMKMVESPLKTMWEDFHEFFYDGKLEGEELAFVRHTFYAGAIATLDIFSVAPKAALGQIMIDNLYAEVQKYRDEINQSKPALIPTRS